MRMDLKPVTYTSHLYAQYIYGSAEVIGLMCLKVFCADDKEYKSLEAGARALGAAYQKVNFLRDLADDHHLLGRYYFPVGSFKNFNEEIKAQIIADITMDFDAALPAVDQLPASAQKAVRAAFVYYQTLLMRLENTPAEKLKTDRVRISNVQKLWLLFKVKLGLV
jgi:phytoene/squalene synthetase